MLLVNSLVKVVVCGTEKIPNATLVEVAQRDLIATFVFRDAEKLRRFHYDVITDLVVSFARDEKQEIHLRHLIINCI